ncbi:MAG: GyrI-like domain-containing protein [Anaerolineae bacterium]
MVKIDLKKELKPLYRPSAKKMAFIDVPQMNYLMVDGRGDPNTSQAYQEAVEALYALAYTLKFMMKKGRVGQDYVVMPLEGLWWVDDMEMFSMEDKDSWQWTAMILQPDPVTQAMLEQAVGEVIRKKNPAAIGRVRLESWAEGLAAQIMYIGPYAEEAPTIAMLHQFIEDNGYTLRGKHHEIYLSDPRRTAPERLKTIIRQPVAPA